MIVPVVVVVVAVAVVPGESVDVEVVAEAAAVVASVSGSIAADAEALHLQALREICFRSGMWGLQGFRCEGSVMCYNVVERLSWVVE